MELLNPELEEVDGCFYRVNHLDDSYYGKNAEQLPYVEFDDLHQPDEFASKADSDDDNGLNIIQRENGYFEAKLHVASIYLPVIIGKKGSSQQRLEKETKSFINVPRKNETGDIIIRSKREEAVSKAYRRIQIMVNTARRKQKVTHFMSIPLINERIQETYLNFKNFVLDAFHSDRGICEKLFQTPSKLHLTIFVLVLADNVEREIARDTLHRFKEMLMNSCHLNRQIKIRMQGLEIMNDDPSEVKILYGKILPDDSFQELVDSASNFFAKTGLTKFRNERVKLHATLMNTKFLSSKSNIIQDDQVATFDASNILKNFGNYDFGEVNVDCLLLSQLHTTSTDGYYETSARINLY